MHFVIGSAANKVDIDIISVFRGSPNVIVEYELSSQKSIDLDDSVRIISFQIASGAEYVDGDLKFPVIGNAVISGDEFISDDAAAATAPTNDNDSDSGISLVAILIIVIVVILVCTAIGVALYCKRVRKKRDRELEAMAAVASLPGFQIVNSEDMPFETGKRGHHAVVPSLSFDIGRITPAFGPSRVPSDENNMSGMSGDDTGTPRMGEHLSLGSGGSPRGATHLSIPH